MQQPSASPPGRSEVPAATPAERVWLWAAILAGAWLRLAYPSRMAVEHFDEAIYASNVLFGAESNWQYPRREMYAPPLLPAAIEWLHIAWGATGQAVPGWLPMVPALTCGIATVPSLWWIARRWFSPQAGIAAAWLIALCEFHAAYSRTALTDVPLALLVLWAVYWFGRALEAHSKWFAVLAGVFTAAAWWTKYNGWLPVAIAATGAVLFLRVMRAPRPAWLRSGAVCAIGGVFAAILWTPVIWDCQDIGGYAAVANNHRGYVEGWSNWFNNARQQFDRHGAAYAGWLTVLGVCGPTLALQLATVSRRRSSAPTSADSDPVYAWDGTRLFWLAVNGVILVVSPGSWFPMLIGVGIICSALALKHAATDRNERLALAAALVLVWVTSLVVATPLYRAYPRLTMPLIVGGVLAASIFWRRGWAPFADAPAGPAWCGCLVIAVLGTAIAFFRGSIAWEDRTGYRAAAQSIGADGASRWWSDTRPALVYAVVEPGFFYQLRVNGAPGLITGGADVVHNAPLGNQLFVAVGPLVGGTDEGRSVWFSQADEFELVGEYRAARLSSITRFDHSPDVAARLLDDDSATQYRLYRWKGRNTGAP